MLIERFFRDQTGRDACGKYGLALLDSTSHLVRARSVATAAVQCIYMARLAEVMGVRGFQYSVIPGKGQVVHLVLSMAFPKLMAEYVSKGELEDSDYRREVEYAVDWLKVNGVLDLTREEFPREDVVIEQSQELAIGGVYFVERAFSSMLGNKFREALSNAVVLTEHNMLSYKLHVWGVADAIIEDPESGRAVIIEWKTYSSSESRTPSISEVDIAQAYVYALLESERLGHTHLKSRFEDYVRSVLGEPEKGRKAKIIPGVVRPSPTGRASRVYVRHPLHCEGPTSKNRCDYYELRKLLAKIVLSAEHLALALTDIRRLENWRSVEDLCKVKRLERERTVFRLTPEIEFEESQIWLPRGNPLREKLRWPCSACHDNVLEACIYYMRSGIKDPTFDDFKKARNEAWRARFAVYEHRENALMPYKQLLKMALDFGVDFSWIKGSLRRRVLPDGSRVDFFEEAYIEDDEVVLIRPPMKWEKENSHLFTLREGKPAAIYFNEEHVTYPFHRLSFHGSVSSVEYDSETDNVTVRVAPANKISRIYPKILEFHYDRRARVFRNVVALEVNVELTQLELLGIAAAEMGTIRRAVKARQAMLRGEEPGEEDLLALLFAGVGLG